MKGKEQDENAINAIFEALGKAWNEYNGQAFGQCFTEDADYVTFNGQHIKGRQAIADIHQKLFNGVLRGSSMTDGGSIQIRFLSPDMAVAHCVGAIKLRWQKKAPKNRDSINTNVLVKEKGDWKIAAFHNCRIQPPNFIQKWLMK
nr:SgcJ/EcaC family oxidoreductase [Paenibacillus sp. yr247]